MVEFSRPRSRISYGLARFYLGCVVPALARLKGREAKTLMAYFWDTIENCVAPETILHATFELQLESEVLSFTQSWLGVT